MKRPAKLYEKSENKAVNCYLCAHRCVIKEGKFGFCGVRKNEDGELFTFAYGAAIAASPDPIEKKPLYHFLPGSRSFSIATAGCNFKCGFCQNWQISQITKSLFEGGAEELTPAEIVEAAQDLQAASISYTYTEPTIFFEYAYDTAKIAALKGLKNIFVTNGYMTKEALDTINPYLDAANVDLKYFKDESYRKVCGGRLKPVLETIEQMKKLDIWVEVTTLVIPGGNDSDEELKGIAGFIAAIDMSMPWHISRFFPQYRYDKVKPTPLATMEKAKEIGEKAGLKYIYLGNVGESSVTVCPSCGEKLISRDVYSLSYNKIKDGNCPVCGKEIQGIWQ